MKFSELKDRRRVSDYENKFIKVMKAKLIYIPLHWHMSIKSRVYQAKTLNHVTNIHVHWKPHNLQNDSCLNLISPSDFKFEVLEKYLTSFSLKDKTKLGIYVTYK